MLNIHKSTVSLWFYISIHGVHEQPKRFHLSNKISLSLSPTLITVYHSYYVASCSCSSRRLHFKFHASCSCRPAIQQSRNRSALRLQPVM
ncbi:hypothetical protein M758_UG206800 [Ceratodon purpureus]|nr:hypothetical protein M758_UG206800 [Ceratodon purpureus]